jgi:hypothetical protein
MADGYGFLTPASELNVLAERGPLSASKRQTSSHPFPARFGGCRR